MATNDSKKDKGTNVLPETIPLSLCQAVLAIFLKRTIKQKCSLSW
jgi:hypothetical protein